MPPIPIITLPARRGVALNLPRDKVIKIVNTYGKQVVGFWALNASNNAEVLSMANTHGASSKLKINIGDALFTNQSRAMLILTEDTSPGVHDTFISACDEGMYHLLGSDDGHANCARNYREALRQLKPSVPGTGDSIPPAPLNLFMNAQASGDGKLTFAPPISERGQFICLKALMDIVVVLSACPMDLQPTNNFKPTEVQYIVLD